ncbi:MAG: hypothetical protein F6K22_13445 [Okeania sp. SIO2F4]|nr:hypothetical protein [Okeania sp. SIO2F4]
MVCATFNLVKTLKYYQSTSVDIASRYDNIVIDNSEGSSPSLAKLLTLCFERH